MHRIYDFRMHIIYKINIAYSKDVSNITNKS